MAIMNQTDEIKSNEDYVKAVGLFGKVLADNMAASSFFTVSPDVVSNAGATYGNGATPVIDDILNKNSSDPTQSDLFKEGGINNLVGNNPYLSMAGAFGDKNTTGWVSPAIGLASSIGKGILGYKQLEETKKNNADKLRLMEEANFMKKVQMKNRVNQANRYAMLGMGNANSQTATMSTVNRTPYTSMNLA